ncbi:MAG: hypothetical protein ABI687_04240 [Flavitalea sp.]
MSKLSKRHFWEWFKRYNKEYLELNKKSNKEAGYWVNELNAHLRAYFKFFGFSITLQDNRRSTLTITVNGKASHFKKADSLVALAPEIPGWRITSLEDPRPADFLLEKQMEDAGIDHSELCFSLSGDDPVYTDIMVYHPLCTEDKESLFSQLVTAALYNLLGERSFGMDIGQVEVANLSSADPDEVQKLEELPAYLGLRRSSMVVDGSGMLSGGGD